jgi:hypothetical protein
MLRQHILSMIFELLGILQYIQTSEWDGVCRTRQWDCCLGRITRHYPVVFAKSVRGLPITFHSFLWLLSFPSGVLSEVLMSFLELQNLHKLFGVLELPLDQPHPTLRHTTVQSILTLVLCMCFPAFLARFPQSILFGSSLARSVVYYCLCIILSYILFGSSLARPEWFPQTARLLLQGHHVVL